MCIRDSCQASIGYRGPFPNDQNWYPISGGVHPTACLVPVITAAVTAFLDQTSAPEEWGRNDRGWHEVTTISTYHALYAKGGMCGMFCLHVFHPVRFVPNCRLVPLVSFATRARAFEQQVIKRSKAFDLLHFTNAKHWIFWYALWVRLE